MGILHFLFHFVISYSNRWKDNLFRVFRVSSFKLSEATENQTNRQVYNKSGRPPPPITYYVTYGQPLTQIVKTGAKMKRRMNL